MKPIWRCITISTFAGASVALSGCAQVNTARQWWRVWRNPVSTVSPATLSSSKVTINLQEVARHHPAWKLAEQLESTPPKGLNLNWSQPGNLSETDLVLHKSTFSSASPVMINASFAEPEQTVTASDMEKLAVQMTQEQQSAWEKWKNNISGDLHEDRQQIEQAMQVDLNDQIAQTQKNIPEIGLPFTPSVEIQNEMINLRLKLLNNIALSPDDKAAAQKRLDQLEAEWTKRLRQQAQQGAENQQYWRETVPHQMREAGEAKIQQTLQLLQHGDQKSIDLTIDTQQHLLEQDAANNKTLLLQLPLVTNQAIHAKSTFRAPLLSTTPIKSTFSPLKAPTPQTSLMAKSSPSEISQLKQIALAAAKRAITQSVSKHHWQWLASNNPQSASLPDATKIVLKEANFQ
mgnify:CR=1 FL=1